MNFILSLTHEDGSMVTNHVDLCDVAKVCFYNFYGASNDDSDPVKNHIPFYLSLDDNSSVLAPFTINELPFFYGF